jgi:predicted alpha/beta-hydrolase family hydrolase
VAAQRALELPVRMRFVEQDSVSVGAEKHRASAAHQGATVFTHGTADPFGSIDELRAAAALIRAPSEIVEVTGARHDLGYKTLDVPVLAVDAALRLLP